MAEGKIIKKYTNGEITVVWEPSKCIHVGNCVRGLPSVFDNKAKPWVNIEGADSQAIIDQVAKCPSGALSILGKENEPTGKTHVQIMPNGPLVIDGEVKLTQGGGSVLLKNKKTAFWRCGASAKKPFCDGSHNTIEFKG